jgi:hypothetical protein
MFAVAVGSQAVVAGMSMVFAAISCGVNVWAAIRAPREFRPMRAAVAVVAGLYVIGYGWLVFTDVDRVEWSSTMVYLAVVAWPLVWITPAIQAARYGKRLDDVVKRTADR